MSRAHLLNDEVDDSIDPNTEALASAMQKQGDVLRAVTDLFDLPGWQHLEETWRHLRDAALKALLTEQADFPQLLALRMRVNTLDEFLKLRETVPQTMKNLEKQRQGLLPEKEEE